MSIGLMMLRWRSKTPLVRRTRPIGEHQNAIGRFLKLRQPFGLPKRKRNTRQSAVRPWPVWRCRLDWKVGTGNTADMGSNVELTGAARLHRAASSDRRERG